MRRRAASVPISALVMSAPGLRVAKFLMKSMLHHLSPSRRARVRMSPLFARVRVLAALALVGLASACVSSCGGGGGSSSTASASPTSAVGVWWFNPTGTSTSPLVLYTDVISGPTSGGENNRGMYLSIFGKNFGSSLTNVQVTIGGHVVPSANVYYLGPSMGRPDVQQLSMQVGSLGGAAPSTALPIEVTVNGIASNSNLTFTPASGKICYVSNAGGTTPEGTSFPAGNDSTGVCGDITHPFATVQGPTDPYTGGVWPNVGAGDTIVLLPTGTAYTGKGVDGYFMRFYRGPSAPGGGSASGGYTTLMGYPGVPSADVPFINAPASTNPPGAVSAAASAYSSAYSAVVDLRIEGGGGDGAVDAQTSGDYWRIVNNELTAKTAAASARSGCIAGHGEYMEILGNSCHDVNSPDSGMENHGVYLDAAGNDEVAYNFLYDLNDGSGVQLFNVVGATPYIDNVAIHHNWIFNVAKYGINIADTSRNGIVVYDNVVANVGYDGIRFNTTDLKGCVVYNNTFYNTDLHGQSGYGSVANDWNLPAGAVQFRNNIFVAYNGTSYISGANGFDSTNSSFSNNLYYGGSGSAAADAAALDGQAVMSNPLFTALPPVPATPPSPSNQVSIPASSAFNLGYFTLQSGSPARGAGSDAASSLILSDFALSLAGAPLFIGALN